ncbi:hypothetical protein XELAEV_18047851mg [Xenopus laevis]|uniref:Uncharacterized protein n=1 Tax=Xenopus laevis TaxID=8355 RepID=A0A974BVZ4_XENLA|nr:hypothetical protein XELAEV_18047851mg [Xenopus laevis]
MVALPKLFCFMPKIMERLKLPKHWHHSHLVLPMNLSLWYNFSAAAANLGAVYLCSCSLGRTLQHRDPALKGTSSLVQEERTRLQGLIWVLAFLFKLRSISKKSNSLSQ